MRQAPKAGATWHSVTRKLVESTCHVEIMETMDKLVSLLIHKWSVPFSLPPPPSPKSV